MVDARTFFTTRRPDRQHRRGRGAGASGRGAAGRVTPRCLLRGDRDDPLALLRAAGVVARARADPAALRPDGHGPLRLPARVRGGDGVGPVQGAPQRHQRAAVRRRAPGELRDVRLGRALPGVRPERLRRDATRARSTGTSSGWPQSVAVAGRHNGLKDKHVGARRPRVRRLVPQHHGGPVDDADPRRVVRRARRRPARSSGCARPPARGHRQGRGRRPGRARATPR